MKKAVALKRLLAIWMSVVFVFSAVSAFAEDADADALQNYPNYSYNMEVLKALGAVDDSIVYPQMLVLRSEFVAFAVKLAGLHIVDGGGFSDVGYEHEMYDYISTAKANKLVRGNDGRFYPDEIITTDEAAIICARLLCREADFRETLKTEAYIPLTDIKKNVTGSLLNYDNAFQMLYNLTDEYMLKYETYTSPNYAETFLGHYRRIEKIKGILTANSEGALTTAKALSGGRIAIDGEVFWTAAGLDTDKYLGYKVDAYLSDEDVVLYCAPKTSYNDTFSIDAFDITAYDNGKLDYISDGRKESVAIDNNADILYNGVPMTTFASEDFLIKNGKITLIDNNKDSNYDCVFIEEYVPYIVEGIDASERIVCKFTDEILKFNDSSDDVVVDDSGNVIAYTTLGNWDVIFVYASKDGTKRKIVKGGSEIEGVIEETRDEDGTTYLNVSGKEFKVSSNATRFGQELKIGTESVFYLDPYGEIVAFNEDFISKSERYGYIIQTKPDALKSTVYVKILDTNDEINVYTAKKKVLVDGVSMGTGMWSEALNVGLPIRYRATEEGVITMIDTPATVTGGDDDSFEMVYTGYAENNGVKSKSTNLTFKNVPNVFGTKVSVTANCSVLTVYSDTKNCGDDTMYYANKLDYLSDDTNYCIEAYKSNADSHDADLLLMYDSTTASVGLSDSKIALSVVDDVRKVVDENGDVTYKVGYYYLGKWYNYLTVDTTVLDDIKVDGKSYIPAKGDIARIESKNGKVTVCKMLYVNKTGKYLLSSNPSDSYIAVPRFQLAYVYEKSGNNIWTTNTQLVAGTKYKVTDEGEGEKISYESKNASKFYIVVYDSEEDEVYLGSVNDIRGFTNTGGTECSKVFIGERYGNPNTLVIYK